MKILSSLLLICILSTQAFAIPDPAPDVLGLYFDSIAYYYCGWFSFLDHVPMYLIVTNSTLVSTRGFECGITIDGVLNSVLTASFPTSATNSGSATNLIVGYTDPMPTSVATVLASFDLFYLDFQPLEFRLGPADPSSDPEGTRPLIMKDDFSLLPLTVWAGSSPVAYMNGPCPLADQRQSFGSVKALFR